MNENFGLFNILKVHNLGACTSFFPKTRYTSIRPIGDYDMAHMITWNNLQRNGS
jgi:hypothetical protein